MVWVAGLGVRDARRVVPLPVQVGDVTVDPLGGIVQIADGVGMGSVENGLLGSPQGWSQLAFSFSILPLMPPAATTTTSARAVKGVPLVSSTPETPLS